MATARRSHQLNPVTVLIVDDWSVMRKCVRSLVETVISDDS